MKCKEGWKTSKKGIWISLLWCVFPVWACTGVFFRKNVSFHFKKFSLFFLQVEPILHPTQFDGCPRFDLWFKKGILPFFVGGRELEISIEIRPRSIQKWKMEKIIHWIINQKCYCFIFSNIINFAYLLYFFIIIPFLLSKF